MTNVCPRFVGKKTHIVATQATKFVIVAVPANDRLLLIEEEAFYGMAASVWDF